ARGARHGWLSLGDDRRGDERGDRAAAGGGEGIGKGDFRQRHSRGRRGQGAGRRWLPCRGASLGPRQKPPPGHHLCPAPCALSPSERNRMKLTDRVINPEVQQRNAEALAKAGVVLPKFSELADPSTIDATIQRDL